MAHEEGFREIERLTAKVSLKPLVFLGRKINELTQHVERLVAERAGMKGK